MKRRGAGSPSASVSFRETDTWGGVRVDASRARAERSTRDKVADVRLAWTREEIILVADLLIRSNYRHLPSSHTDVVELSGVLRSAKIHPAHLRESNFRSPGSVHRKMADIGTSDPQYDGVPTHGNRLDKKVLLEFQENPTEMSKLARAIRAGIAAGVEPVSESDLDEYEAWEGRVVASVVRRVERSRILRERKLKSVEVSGGEIACEVCEFDFAKRYGVRGTRYIEVHHVRPLSLAGPSQTALEDLALLCANCHRMIHRSPLLTPAELRRQLSPR